MSKVYVCVARGSGKTNIMKESLENAAKQQIEDDSILKNKENEKMSKKYVDLFTDDGVKIKIATCFGKNIDELTLTDLIDYYSYKTKTNIKELIGESALLEQLAEEAAELSKAALKKARILRGENPTPVTINQASVDLIEEYTDVVHCAIELGLLADDEQIKRKQIRWESRIKEAKGNE